ncbi:hypothetical protein E1B28_006946 [Marasmius oreades]|uniref:AB hydrolase-1 domain-containing protein n=1 Tax=Marasmius oreades TaxID=181124 RepID=A0A9P7S180_9AGAR|nr:uncharacterized protein E1B28_006946 [Marasmius oreades]KAG7093263.1 hypothetical protein E1B28_006946 [Marasmius oreades]
MPSVTVKSSTGTTKFKYNISTPSNASAKAIQKNLPTVLFIPAVYLQRDIFHLQFGDPKLRRFNLVTFDLRAHGETAGTKIPEGYGQEDSVEDVVKLMEALKLPACHIVGMSLGSIIALQMAITYPEKVASLFLVSPLGLEEPDYVTAARVEIYKYWTEGFLCQLGTRTDDSALQDASYGACQFAFSNKTNSLNSAYAAKFLPVAKKNWGPENFDVFHRATVDFFTQRRSHSVDSLKKIKVPITLVHGMDDISYPVEYSIQQEKIFRDAGLKVTLHKLAGAPHFAVVDLKMEVNQLIHDFVLENSGGRSTPIPPGVSIVSPWDGVLRKAGWVPEEEEEDEDEDVEFVS